jgi:NAD(P)-dependent dehydrogenase (short-subunit alcohol dehydrogenase family)
MKKVLVIGSSGLLGSHLVKALLGKAEVVEASLSRAALTVDISDPASLRRLFERVGAVDAIACTAGMARFVPWAGATDNDWTHGVANKLMGQVNVARLGAPYVRDGGAITLTTGVLAQYPMPGGAIFTTANAAVEGFARAAAVEIGSRVRVNVVSPGWITETLVAMGMDPAPGLPAAEAAGYYIEQMERGAAGSVLAAAKRH